LRVGLRPEKSFTDGQANVIKKYTFIDDLKFNNIMLVQSSSLHIVAILILKEEPLSEQVD